LLLITNHTVESVSAELVSLIYRRRWSVELFFRWIKCILGCRHFFAESEEGAAIQIYLALIAGLMLQLFTGSRPNNRVMEFLQLYMMGWATAQEVSQLIPEPSQGQKSLRFAIGKVYPLGFPGAACTHSTDASGHALNNPPQS
jgi:Transposase DDE domain